MSQDTFQKVKDQKDKIADVVSKKKDASSSQPGLEATDLQQIQIFNQISEKSKEIVPSVVPTSNSMCDITNDNNLI